jgi:hypothetical protein
MKRAVSGGVHATAMVLRVEEHVDPEEQVGPAQRATDQNQVLEGEGEAR